MSGPRVYIHELVDITGHQRARYLHHVTANWAPIGRAERGQLCFGVWATVGSTGRWPQVVNLWEYESWAALGRNFEVELTGDGLQDPSLDEWWSAAASMRSGGTDRILVSTDWSPSVSELCAAGRTAAAGYVHEIVSCERGARGALLDLVRDEGIEQRRAGGLSLVGAFARAMADDREAVLVWSFERWDDWARSEAAPVSGWVARARELVVGWERTVMADAPLSPLRTGRQPQVSDRRPLESF